MARAVMVSAVWSSVVITLGPRGSPCHSRVPLLLLLVASISTDNMRGWQAERLTSRIGESLAEVTRDLVLRTEVELLEQLLPEVNAMFSYTWRRSVQFGFLSPRGKWLWTQPYGSVEELARFPYLRGGSQHALNRRTNSWGSASRYGDGLMSDWHFAGCCSSGSKYHCDDRSPSQPCRPLY